MSASCTRVGVGEGGGLGGDHFVEKPWDSGWVYVGQFLQNLRYFGNSQIRSLLCTTSTHPLHEPSVTDLWAPHGSLCGHGNPASIPHQSGPTRTTQFQTREYTGFPQLEYLTRVAMSVSILRGSADTSAGLLFTFSCARNMAGDIDSLGS